MHRGIFSNNQSVSTDHSNLLSHIKECREITRCKSIGLDIKNNNKTIMDYGLPIINSASHQQ